MPRGQTSPGVGMLVKGDVCIIVINKNKQHKNNLWILEKCHGKDLIQNVEYALKTKQTNKQTKQQQQQQ